MKGINFDQQLSELKEKHYQDTIKQQRKHQEELNKIHTEKMIYKAKYEKLLADIKNKCVVLFCVFFIVGVIGAYRLIILLGYAKNNNFIDATLVAVAILYYCLYKWVTYKLPNITLWHDRYLVGAAAQGFLCSFVIIIISHFTNLINISDWIQIILILLAYLFSFIIRAITEKDQ